ncbi:hypothetical protein O181_072859 [Austropuccinia psidii MF-1]|uniref:GAR domain-containing protein n=1 Tax=Austropuccinia psidii MF-1 TaxID=1389203 RepID=A0A9Q3F5K4_9BASI|nr:hypothetical protein [Austropuccinia psidii MF-1]
MRYHCDVECNSLRLWNQTCLESYVDGVEKEMEQIVELRSSEVGKSTLVRASSSVLPASSSSKRSTMSFEDEDSKLEDKVTWVMSLLEIGSRVAERRVQLEESLVNLRLYLIQATPLRPTAKHTEGLGGMGLASPAVCKPRPNPKIDKMIRNVVTRLAVAVHVAPADGWEDNSGMYWIGEKIYFFRILRSQTVMVRIGGGWSELSRKLTSDVQCTTQLPGSWVELFTYTNQYDSNAYEKSKNTDRSGE